MGTIRLLLAIAVVIGHTSSVFGLTSVGGIIAVQSFFMISGFYMALILNEKYKGPGSYKLFISNRFLKIFPAYWVVIALIVLISVIKYSINKDPFTLYYYEFADFLHPLSWIYLVLTNIVIFGQDLVMFMEFKPSGMLDLTAWFQFSKPPVHIFLLVPQAWSLAIELMFYLIAPLFVRRSAKTLTVILLSSLALRFYIYATGFPSDPFTYRFFPNELAFFIAGAIAYKQYVRLKEDVLTQRIGQALLLVIGTVILFYPFIWKTNPDAKQWIFYAVFAFSLPYIFTYSKSIKTDQWIGELSYPIYISHVFIFHLLGSFNVFQEKQFTGILSILCTLLFSMILVNYVMKPIETYRQNRVNQLKRGPSKPLRAKGTTVN
ncbi:acyltransferase family protein [Paenibacillus sp. HJGM_3]|uniref:acyltransferase family protein n=1 Tax=Paenibacillus sp. HJGM_3 TaxID=3379816 RepID=UPI00385BA138